jgi:hypothetical protein
MRLLAWNIRQGGGSRLPRIADALKRHDADIVVLSEYRVGPSAPRLCAALHAHRPAATVCSRRMWPAASRVSPGGFGLGQRMKRRKKSKEELSVALNPLQQLRFAAFHSDSPVEFTRQAVEQFMGKL